MAACNCSVSVAVTVYDTVKSCSHATVMMCIKCIVHSMHFEPVHPGAHGMEREINIVL